MRIGGGALVNTHRCCEIAASDSRSEPFAAPAPDGAPHPLTFARRCLDIAHWIVPSVILALVPKCPACLAGYLAVGTGFGLSLLTAAHVRASLLILCIISLLYLVVRRLGRFVMIKGRHEHNHSIPVVR
jgi:hypothetical protein